MNESDLDSSTSTKRTSKRVFLEQMDREVPWESIVNMAAQCAQQASTRKSEFSIESMLRIFFMQQWFTFGDLAMEEALCEVPLFREFAGLTASELLPDESAIETFRLELDAGGLARPILSSVDAVLRAKGLRLEAGMAIDATLIESQLSTEADECRVEKTDSEKKQVDAESERTPSYAHQRKPIRERIESSFRRLERLSNAASITVEQSVLEDLSNVLRLFSEREFKEDIVKIGKMLPRPLEPEHCGPSRCFMGALDNSCFVAAPRSTAVVSQAGTVKVIECPALPHASPAPHLEPIILGMAGRQLVWSSGPHGVPFSIAAAAEADESTISLGAFYVAYRELDMDSWTVRQRRITEPDKVKRLPFGQWFNSECVRYRVARRGSSTATVALSRGEVVKAMANYYGGSHYRGDGGSTEKKLGPAIESLMEFKIGGLALPYFLLLAVSQDLLRAWESASRKE